MPSQPLTLKNYYQIKPKFSGVYSRNDVPNLKEGGYVKIFHEFKPIETH